MKITLKRTALAIPFTVLLSLSQANLAATASDTNKQPHSKQGTATEGTSKNAQRIHDKQSPNGTYYSSDTAKTFGGIGDLKIGMSLSDFHSWAINNEFTVKTYNNYKNEIDEPRPFSVAMRLEPNPANEILTPMGATYVPGHQAIRLKLYQPSLVPIREVILIFDQTEELISISGKAENVVLEALNTKYGEAKEATKTNEVTCVFVFTGAKTKKIEKTTRLLWRQDNQVRASAFMFNSYDNKCAEISGSSFLIENTKKHTDYATRNQTARENFYKNIEVDRKEALKKSLDKL